jgi:hypothetical protein
MRINTGLSVLAGAVALACSGGAFAQTTTANSTGTIFINIIDTTNDTSFMFDTGLSVASFADPTSYTANLATSSTSSAAYAAFVAGESNAGGVPDSIDYSVVGNYTPTSGTPYAVTLVTANSKPTTIAGVAGAGAAGQIEAFVATINNPAGGATYNGAGTPATSTWNGGYEAGLTNEMGTSDNALVGTSLDFYAITTNTSSGTRNGAVVSAFTGTWDLTSGGLLSYSEGSPVPLPTPLLLLLSGLGLMGLVARRGQPASGRTSLNGAAA